MGVHNVPTYTEAFEAAVNGRVPDEYVTTTVNAKGGVTTTYLVPRPLALTAPFAKVAPRAVNTVNKVLTPTVNRGYSSLTPEAGPYLAPGGKLVSGKSATVLGRNSVVRAVDNEEVSGSSPRIETT